MHIDPILDRIYRLPESAKSMLRKYIGEVSYPKGHLLLHAGRVEKKIYFLKKGIVRAYANKDHGEMTFWFGKEGDTVISMKSYIEGREGYENIELLENCELFELKTNELQGLFEKDIHIANWGRKFAERELIHTEERLISSQFQTATARYQELLRTNPDLVKRVPLGYIASYLGITQVSLSRIRSDVRR